MKKALLFTAIALTGILALLGILTIICMCL